MTRGVDRRVAAPAVMVSGGIGDAPAGPPWPPAAMALRTPLLLAVFCCLFAVQARISSVVEEVHGIPSFIIPLGAVLVVVTAGLHLAEARTVPELLGPATTSVMLALGLLLAVRLPGLITSADRDLVGENVVFYLKDSFVAAAVVFTAERVDGLRAAVLGMLGAAAGLAALAIHKAMTDSLRFEYWGFSRATDALITARDHGTRFTGPLEDPNYFAQILVVAVGLATAGLLGFTSTRWRVAMAGVVAVCLLAIGLSYSRGGMLAVGIIGVVAAYRRFRGRAVVGLLVVGLVFSWAAPASVVGRFGSITEVPMALIRSGEADDPSLNGRTSELLVAISMFAENPAVGVGAGTYDANYLGYAADGGIESRRVGRAAHNLALEAAAETGVVGLVGFLGFVGLAVAVPGGVARRLRAAGELDRAALAEGLQLAVVGYLVTAVFLHDAFSRLFVLVMALAIAAVMLERSELADRPGAEHA